MAYMHINNLYKSKEILEFKECYAMEKIHGTSAHITWNGETEEVGFFSGGSSHQVFVKIFDEDILRERFREMDGGRQIKVTVYGEAYGGKLHGMRHTYGSELKFVAFEVKIGEHTFLSVPQAHDFVTKLGLEFVDYARIPTTMDAIDAELAKPSTQGIRNGMGEHTREGIVLRPPFEVRMNNRARVVAKHKNEEFQERVKQPKPGQDPKVLSKAKEIAEEWVVPQRLEHVIDQVKAQGYEIDITITGEIVKTMQGDVKRESEGEVEWSKTVEKAIGSRTAKLFKGRLKAELYGGKS
jgi:hypothetical protein